LEEELIDTLEMVPAGVHVVVAFHTSLSETEVGFLDTRERSENIFFDHLDNLI
jgi:hypothetical protein